jgi:hypothetical protein
LLRQGFFAFLVSWSVRKNHIYSVRYSIMNGIKKIHYTVVKPWR